MFWATLLVQVQATAQLKYEFFIKCAPLLRITPVNDPPKKASARPPINCLMASRSLLSNSFQKAVLRINAFETTLVLICRHL